MRFEFRGEFQSLNEFRRKVRKTPDVLVTVNEQLAEEAIELVREGFEQSRAPDGTRWAPLKLRAGNPLEDTGGLKTSWHRRWADRSGFAIASAKSYAIHHQRGTGLFGPHHQRIRPIHAKALRLPGPIFRKSVAGSPARPMVPSGEIPPAWAARFVGTAREVFTELYRSG